MAEVYAVNGFNGSGWDIPIADFNRIAMCGSSFGNSISVGGFQNSTHSSDSAMTVDGCVTNHMRNCKYVSPTEVQLMDNPAVFLDAANVGRNDCTTRWMYQDDAVNTVLTNINFFFYDGVTPANAPAGVNAVAFERTASAIRKNRIGGDASGKAWDSSYGIGGSANALSCENQGSGSIHYFYLGISLSPTSKGLKTACRARLEFDVS